MLATMTGSARRRGGDGKSYLSRPLSAAERLHIAVQVHQLRCAGGLTVPGVRAALAAEGITRSAGSVHAALHRWCCARCSSPVAHRCRPSPRIPAQVMCRDT